MSQNTRKSLPSLALSSLLALPFSTFSSCKADNDQGTEEQSTPNSRQKASEDATAIPFASRFRDAKDFNLEDLKQGKACTSLRANKLAFSFAPWPAPLRSFLADELTKVQSLLRIFPKLQGVYLVDFSPDLISSITCHNAKTDQYAIFISKKLVSLDRNMSKVDTAPYIRDGRSQGIPSLESPGDGALRALIHEGFHVLDWAFYFDHFTALMEGSKPKDPVAAAARKNFYQASWTPNNPFISLFQNELNAAATPPPAGPESAVKASIPSPKKEGANASPSLSLTNLETAIPVQSKGSTTLPTIPITTIDHVELALVSGQVKDDLSDNHAKPSSSLLLADDFPDLSLRERRLRIIAEKTNFANDEASANFQEDFAVTLEQYTMGIRYGMWQRVEFFAPLEPYVFSTQDLMNLSTPQGKKTCAAVQDLLGEECKLPTQ